MTTTMQLIDPRRADTAAHYADLIGRGALRLSLRPVEEPADHPDVRAGCDALGPVLASLLRRRADTLRSGEVESPSWSAYGDDNVLATRTRWSPGDVVWAVYSFNDGPCVVSTVRITGRIVIDNICPDEACKKRHQDVRYAIIAAPGSLFNELAGDGWQTSAAESTFGDDEAEAIALFCTHYREKYGADAEIPALWAPRSYGSTS